MQKLLPALTLALGLAVGAAAMFFWRSAPAPEAPPASPAGDATSAARPESQYAAPEREVILPRAEPPAGARAPTDVELDPEREHYVEDEPPAGDVPPRVVYAVAEKYGGPPVSDTPHRLLGAWDEAPQQSRRGDRRGFVAVVEPGTPDAEIETLLRDLLRQHDDAVIVHVRVYDSEEAATQAGGVDGGSARFQHLVGEANVNRSLPVEALRVRGRRLDP